VTSFNDYGPGTLRDLIAGSAANDTILCPNPGSIGLYTGELVISHNLAIIGPGPSNLFVDGYGHSRVFHILSGTVSITGLNINDGVVYGDGGLMDSRNGGNGYGAGIYNAGTLALTNCTISANSAYGGIGFADDSANPLGSGGGAYGGGIYNDVNGSLTLVNCFVTFNTVAGGNGGEATNVAGSYGLPGVGYGGGIYSVGTNCELSGCTFYLNTAGGGIGSTGGDAMGGAILVAAGTNLLVNCTIVTNTAVPAVSGGSGSAGKGYGAGLAALTTGGTGVALMSCTINGNTLRGFQEMGATLSGPGMAMLQDLPFTVENSLIAGNLDDSLVDISPAPDVYGHVVSGGYNLISQADSSSSGWVGSDQVGTTSMPIDPLLGPLQDNGGPTLTLSLPPNSPALNQGKSFGLATDQRGYVRPFRYPSLAPIPTGGDGSDIGAYERSFRLPLLNLVLIHQPEDVAEITFPSDPIFPGDPAHPTNSIFKLQFSTNGLDGITAVWRDLQSPMRMLDGQFVSRDTNVMLMHLNPGLGGVYRGAGVPNNPNFVTGPLTLQADNITPSTATLNGTDIPIGGQTSYWFQYGYTTSYGLNTPTSILPTSANVNALTAAISGLVPLEQYHCQLVVNDNWGTQLGGDTTFTTPGYPPAAVTSVATSITTTSAVLNGTVDDNGTAMAGYFEYGFMVGPPCCTYILFNNTPHFYGPANANVNPYTVGVSNLNPSTTYYFYITAFNSFGMGVGVTNSFTTADPPPPAPVTQPPSYDINCPDCAPYDEVLNGTVNGNGYAFYGYFEYGPVNGGGPVTYSYDTSANSFSGNNSSPQSFNFDMNTVAGTLVHGTTYNYRIVAFSTWSGVEADGANETFIYP
jgi:hypothetical protein